jgi:hypothetical protein
MASKSLRPSEHDIVLAVLSKNIGSKLTCRVWNKSLSTHDDAEVALENDEDIFHVVSIFRTHCLYTIVCRKVEYIDSSHSLPLLLYNTLYFFVETCLEKPPCLFRKITRGMGYKCVWMGDSRTKTMRMFLILWKYPWRFVGAFGCKNLERINSMVALLNFLHNIIITHLFEKHNINQTMSFSKKMSFMIHMTQWVTLSDKRSYEIWCRWFLRAYFSHPIVESCVYKPSLSCPFPPTTHSFCRLAKIGSGGDWCLFPKFI